MWEIDPVEKECQARRAEERVQWYVVPALLQNVSSIPVWNRDRGKGRKRFYLAPVHVSQNLEDAILDLHRCQLTEQLLRTTQEHRGVEVENQRQIEKIQINQEVQIN